MASITSLSLFTSKLAYNSARKLINRPYGLNRELINGLSQVPYGPLHGILVVGFDGQISAALAVSRLVQDGAVGIKIESENGGDPKRSNSSPTAFNTYNVGKFGVTFNRKNPEDLKKKSDLLTAAHVIIDNRSKDARDRDKELEQTLLNKNRSHPLIYCVISGFGANNDRRFYDRLGQAGTGIAMMNSKEGAPSLINSPIIDVTTGIEAAAAISKHLYWLEKQKPKGINVIQLEVNMMKVAFGLISNTVATYLDTGQIESTIVPFGLYKTKDGHIAVAIAKDDQFKVLCGTLNIHYLADKYPTNADRLKHKSEVEYAMKEVLQQESSDYWVQLLNDKNIPVEPVRTLLNALETYGDDIVRLDKNGKKYIGEPVTSSAFTANPPIKTAPAYGEDNIFLGQLLKQISDNDNFVQSLVGEAIGTANKNESNHGGGYYGPTISQQTLRELFKNKKSGQFEWAKDKPFWVIKRATVTAEKITSKESIDILVHGFNVLTQTGLPGNWKITQKSGEAYFLSPGKFQRYYKPTENKNEYSYVGKPRRAIQLTKDLNLQTPDSWGGKVLSARQGSILILSEDDNVYAVHPSTFKDNFRKCNSLYQKKETSFQDRLQKENKSKKI